MTAVWLSAAVVAVELVGNRLLGRAVDKCVGSLSVHALIHGSAPVIHKSIAHSQWNLSYNYPCMYPAGKDLL